MAPIKIPSYQSKIATSKTIFTLAERGKAEGLVSFIQIIEKQTGENDFTLKLKTYNHQFFIFDEKMNISEIKDAVRDIVSYQFFTKLHADEVNAEVFSTAKQSRKIFKKMLNEKYFSL